MLKPASIPSKPHRPITQDFAALRREALNWLQHWCHESWTDFNESDPGVTLLEELCYALTDLGLRTELPIPRLINLPEGPDPTASWTDNSIYPPEEVFPMEPLTPEDYRKRLLDECLDVLEARCFPLPNGTCDSLSGVAGRYVASVLLDPDRPLGNSLAQRFEEIRRSLNRHRNLGERFERVEPIPIVRFSVRGRLVLAAGHAADQVLANAYLEVRRALLPSVEQRSVSDGVSADVPPSEAWVGPLLRHGWLAPASDPLALPWHEVEQRTLDAFRRVPGLVDVQLEWVRPESAPDGAVRLMTADFVVSAEATGPSTNAILVDPAPTESDLGPRVTRLIQSGILSTRPPGMASVHRSAGVVTPENPAPGFDVATFEPIGNGLPRVYGLGPGGAFDDDNPQRRARSKQLLAFLLFFEQLAADQAAQLAHVRDLFSHRTQETTRFSQPLYHVPGVLSVLQGSPRPPEGAPSPAERRVREAEFIADDANPYARGLRELGDTPRRFRHRRAQFLDHLLARFGEAYPLVDPATQETLANKEWVLRHLPRLGRRRASGRDLDPAQTTDPRSGLEERIALLLSRDDRSTALIDPDHMEAGAAPLGPAASGPFHFLVEHLLFLPAAGADSAEAGATQVFELALFRSRITHVLLNWTVRPLNPAFQRYTENLIRAQVGAHLESRFLWFERDAFAASPADDTAALHWRKLAALHAQWVELGSPPLRLAAAPEATSLKVHADDVAAQLFTQLNQPDGPTRLWPEK